MTQCLWFQLSSTCAATITHAIKVILVCTSLPLSPCRGQVYDGAATMQEKQSGVATRLKEEEPAAVPLHCLAHSLNLCLQDAARSIIIIHDAMDTVREIVKLINYSSKRKALFASKLCEQTSRVVVSSLFVQLSGQCRQQHWKVCSAITKL